MSAEPWRVFVVLGLISGSLFVFLTPPFQGPDEPSHFARAWEISRGRLQATAPSTPLPENLADAIAISSRVTFDSGEKVTISEITGSMRGSMGERDVYHAGAAIYTPVPYAPQAAVIALLRPLIGESIALLYVSRLANLICSTLILAGSLAILPFSRSLFLLLALTPMFAFLRSTASPDAITGSVAFLLTALILRMSFSSDSPGRRDVLLLLACSAVLVLSKPIYAFLPLLACMIPHQQFRSTRARTALAVSLLVITSLALVIAMWNAHATFQSIRADEGISPRLQLEAMLDEPARFPAAAFNDYAIHYRRYVAEMIGNLGWLDTPLPISAIAAWALLLIAVALVDGPARLGVREKTICSTILAASMLLLSASLYLGWTPAGAARIEGLQGRYFIPLMPLGLLLLQNRKWGRDRWNGAVRWRSMMVLTSSAVLLITAITLLQRYWIL
ncbi:MAG TPA: DUF2142 domain-containing protein [Thermoanaerobaculia bacterium]|nr:DUF2142 domain-containing protein [Thermoanaerobaculia bacterium]